MNGMTSSRLALKKFRGDAAWATITSLILIAGLSASMVMPSAGSTLESGVENYANAVGTYINVQPNGYSPYPSATSLLPSSIVTKITNLEGVQTVYPMLTNESSFVSRNVTIGGTTIKELNVELTTALIGGDSGFPPRLIELLQGRMPRVGAAEILSFSNTNATTARSLLNMTEDVVIGRVEFNATIVGVAAANLPVTGNIAVLFDRSYLAAELGPVEFNQMFQRDGYNYLVVKVQSIGQVSAVSNEVDTMLEPYPSYQTQFDPASVLNLMTLVSQTAPFYEAMGAISLAVTSTLTGFVIWLGVRKRNWEAGLLVVQGWEWRSVWRLYFLHYLVLTILSFLAALFVSALIGPLIGFDMRLYGQEIGLSTTLQPVYILLTLAVAVATSLAASILVSTRLRKLGLDSILRDY